MRENAIATTCAMAGGGPAGVMLGLLLARAGIEVTVLEKHADFLRDFRGDTIHPSTLEVMHELGLLDALLARPHEKMREAGVEITDLSTHLQGQLVAVHPAFDEALVGAMIDWSLGP